MRIFVQNQGVRKILPQAYTYYSEDKILGITRSLEKKTISQELGREVNLPFLLSCTCGLPSMLMMMVMMVTARTSRSGSSRFL
jgi:hypothetical protein